MVEISVLREVVKLYSLIEWNIDEKNLLILVEKGRLTLKGVSGSTGTKNRHPSLSFTDVKLNFR